MRAVTGSFRILRQSMGSTVSRSSASSRRNRPEAQESSSVFDPGAVAGLRTDLDSFGDMEVAALINAGYDRADRFLHSYFAGSQYAGPANPYWESSPVAPRHISDQYMEALPNVLIVGRSHFFRSLRLWSLPSWIFTAAVVGAGLYFFGCNRLSVAALVNHISGWMLNRLENPLPLFPHSRLNRWAQCLVVRSWRVWPMLAGLAAVAFIVFKGWPYMVDRFQQTRAAKKRKVITFVKWIRALAPALLLLAGLAPVWLAAAASAIAFVSYWAYDRPFLWATRIRQATNLPH